MLIEIKNGWVWRRAEKCEDMLREFFTKNGKFKEESQEVEETRIDNEGNETKEKVTKYNYEFKYIGNIDAVPVEILNHKEVEKEFYQDGVQVMAEKHYNFDKFESAKSSITIHMPSNILLTINHTIYIEDACTDELQIKLDDGYRIIACIPQVGQRRPDYILGRADIHNN